MCCECKTVAAGAPSPPSLQTTCDATGGTFERWIPGIAPGILPPPTPPGAAQPAPAGHWMVYEPGHVTAELITSMRASVGGPPDAHPSDESELCAGWMGATSAARDAFIDTAGVSAAMCPLTLGSVEFLQQDPFAGGCGCGGSACVWPASCNLRPACSSSLCIC